MSKGNSGLFLGTSGSQNDFIKKLEKDLSVPDSENTAEVWSHIHGTAENYDETVIPKSFTIDVPLTEATPDGKLWTHGNATEHMYEAVTSIKNSAPAIVFSNPKLYSQFILYDYYKSLSKAVSKGVKYEKTVTVGNWEFIIVKPRPRKERDGIDYPVVKHALFTGLEK